MPAARRVACPPIPPPLLSHITARCLPVCSACLQVTACCLPGRALASSQLSLCPTLLHHSRGLARSECSIPSTLPRSAAFLTAHLLGAWGSAAAGTSAPTACLVDRRHRCPYPPRRVPLRCETPLVGAIGGSGHPHPAALFAEKGA